ncbi:CCR4-NOT transcriptional complex subunit CAF120 [Microdochium nivale]|nr:CCR4-NOT transcriptional complex subunit CAF120 [Microdochium nivale]
MVRKRVLSFMSHFSSDNNRNSYTTTTTTTITPATLTPESVIPPTKTSFPPYPAPTKSKRHSYGGRLQLPQSQSASATSLPPVPPSPAWDSREQSPTPAEPSPTNAFTRSTRGRSNSRPLSMIAGYQAPTMDINEDTIPELQPIFGFLNTHGNKLYQEGYFLKLDDQNTQGKPNPDRTWTECFAQLVGPVLSLWDAAELDAAGEDGEVLPKFINLTDASIKMIESLPTSSAGEQPLQNILSISTAGKNRYLLHFNSKHSLIQWTAGIRLSMFEHATLQEAYTGALLAGKGKTLNNISVIMERAHIPVEHWVRVRFGAGTPWRRCWCVITPPNEKEYQKMQKEIKKKGPYDRTRAPVLKGDIKFYDQRKDGKKQKKLQPIATITDAYSSYALYPQAKSLIDASTLIKLEGSITIHADPPSASEGFVFIMPEVNPAISGFEMMMRFLFPTWDVFGLYGRPGRLVTSVLDQRSLMFAMPKGKRYGYLELLDVSSLILTEGSSGWNESEWRKKLKELTSTRMNAVGEDGEMESGPSSRSNSQAGSRLSGGTPQPGQRQRVGFAAAAEQPSPVRSSRSMSLTNQRPDLSVSTGERAPPGMVGAHSRHSRNSSDPSVMGPLPHHPAPNQPSPLSARGPNGPYGFPQDLASTPERMSSEDELGYRPSPVHTAHNMSSPEPVVLPPRFSHLPGEKPQNRPYHSPELRRANSRLSSTTLAQLAQNGGVAIDGGSSAGYPGSEQGPVPPQHRDQAGPSPVLPHINHPGMPANSGREALTQNYPQSPGLPPPGVGLQSNRSQSPMNPNRPPQPDYRRASPGGGPDYRSRSDSRPSTAGSQASSTTSGARGPTGRGGGPPPGRGGGQYPGRGGGPPGRGGGPPPGYRGRGGPGPGRGRGMPPHMVQQGGPHMPPGQNMYRQPGSPEAERPLQVSSVVARKPVLNGTIPARGDSLGHHAPREALSPPPQSSASSFTSASIDSSIMNKIGGPPQGDRSEMRRHDTIRSDNSSHYDDAASTDSPDYASTRPSFESQGSVERPRAGVLKTTGNTDLGQSDPQRRNPDVPDIDFGPTMNYAAAQRSRTPTGIPASQPGPAYAAHHTSSSAGLQNFAPALGPQRQSPAPQAAHDRQTSNDSARRSMIWHPPSATPQQGVAGGGGMSAEQFVQHRAASATPHYAHHRQSSSATLSGYRAGTPTPPLNKTGSQDYIGIAHSRNNSQELLQRPLSRELLQRPSSRGAGAVLGGQGEAHLSAREQEQVARATGSPLIQMPGSRNAAPSGGGLVGAIQTREREREQAKQGWANQSTQHAIQQRQMALQQQQQQQQAYQQQPYQQYQAPGSPGTPRGPPPLNGYANIGRDPGYGSLQSPMQQNFAIQQQGYFPPLGASPEQQGSWGAGGRGMTPQLQQAPLGYGNMQQPIMQVNQQYAQLVPGPPLQSHYQAQGQGQGQGSSQGHHGQAF